MRRQVNRVTGALALAILAVGVVPGAADAASTAAVPARVVIGHPGTVDPGPKTVVIPGYRRRR